ncbi:hypothetical protein DPMN_013575 [Dreissena polymorpha]|uniref:Uncharacterized protein n=1 Tax=Dreissena polymorpha TaxID=45954 RepID=A0A9D4N4H4_DREPO|nr:hypothetical protein DPMN_013575 [Dreissena polymorpha]
MMVASVDPGDQTGLSLYDGRISRPPGTRRAYHCMMAASEDPGDQTGQSLYDGRISRPRGPDGPITV